MPKKKTAGIGRKHKGVTKDAARLEAKRLKEAEAEAAAKEEPAFVPEVEAEPEEEEPEEEPPPAKKGRQSGEDEALRHNAILYLYINMGCPSEEHWPGRNGVIQDTPVHVHGTGCHAKRIKILSNR